MGKPKYEAGKFYRYGQSVLIEILGVIPEEQPVYALTTVNCPGEVKWFTEFELEDDLGGVLKEADPDYEAWSKLKVGDMILGYDMDDKNKSEGHYFTVLARVGDVVLLSSSPHDHSHPLEKVIERVGSHIAEQLEELTDGEVKMDVENAKERKAKHMSLRYTQKIAGAWKPLEELARSGAQIMGGE